MLSKNKLKYLRSLARKKNRDNESVFIAENDKLVADLLDAGLKPNYICATEEFVHVKFDGDRVAQEELNKVSQLKTPQNVLAVFPQLKHTFSPEQLNGKLTLALDSIQDPGNMGTIIRLADWFGIEYIICSKTTVDIYNPKVIQATMGAIARVKVVYTDLEELLSNPELAEIPKYATTLDGQNIYDQTLNNEAILIMGNEGKGVSPEVAQLVSHKLYIPSYPANVPTSESLNVAIATAVACAEFRRVAGS
ncbi:RNA methyltransferase [Prolixibacteraceae bacterium JC049]|nr:RNA methyltransferase [Prolixibacteraceae bacterium JC049]